MARSAGDWRRFHISHYDWWTFPIDRPSQHGLRYTVYADDVARLKADMADPAYDAAIKATAEIAQALGIEGTPGFIVDAKVNVGFLPADGLKQLVAEARQAGCQVC